jgi:Helix-turn-helix of DDE superfamily endonuclease
MESQRISIFANVKSDRQYKATTGLSEEEFNELSAKFSNHYTPYVLINIPEGFGQENIFQDPSEALFFLLYHHKTAVTYDVLAVNFGIGRSTAHNSITFFKQILKLVLTNEGVLPKRLFSDAEELKVYFAGVPDLLVDATETPTQRPDNHKEQEERYSKKNISTVSKTPLLVPRTNESTF